MPQPLDHLTREQLEERRNELHVELAAVNDQLQRRNWTRNGDLAAARRAAWDAAGTPLECSDLSA
jgi:hypothetical protein